MGHRILVAFCRTNGIAEPSRGVTDGRWLRGVTLALLCLAALAGFAAPAEARYAAIVVDADTGRVLHGKNVDQRLYPASLTKMMTLYLTFDALKRKKLSLNQRLKVSRRAAGQTPSKLGLKRGRTITVRQAILAVVTKSANDAATVLAEALAPTESHFAQSMTRKARQLGMAKTKFRNATGLPNRRQRSTARDMARLAMALINDHGDYYRYFSTKQFRYGKRTHQNHNYLLENYSGTDGIKTGYIRASGFNIVASVKRGDDRLVGVIFGGRTARSRDRHMIGLLDRGFRDLASARRKSGRRLAKSGKPLLTPPLPKSKPWLVSRAAPPSRPRNAQTNSPNAVAPDAIKAAAPLGWGVQVGAFRQLATAESAARRAAAATALASGDNVAVARVSHGGGPVYRAWLSRLSERDAQQVCRDLSRKRMACALVQPSGKVKFALPWP